MASASEQLLVLKSEIAGLRARVTGLSANGQIYAAMGERVFYGCKVVFGGGTSMLLSGLQAGDALMANPDASLTPLYQFEYPNIASLQSGGFYSLDLSTDIEPAPTDTSLGRYDIAYIYVGPSGPGFAIATGTPSADVKTQYTAYGISALAYSALADVAIPVGALALARIYVSSAAITIADLRPYLQQRLAAEKLYRRLDNKGRVDMVGQSGSSPLGITLPRTTPLIPGTGAFSVTMKVFPKGFATTSGFYYQLMSNAAGTTTRFPGIRFSVSGSIVSVQFLAFGQVFTVGETLSVQDFFQLEEWGFSYRPRTPSANGVVQFYRGGAPFGDPIVRIPGATESFTGGADLILCGTTSSREPGSWIQTVWYNKELSAREFAAEYEYGPSLTTGIIGWWHADDAQGSPGQVPDRSGNKIHALLNDTGVTVYPPKLNGVVLGTNTWAASNSTQYVAGLNYPHISTKAAFVTIYLIASVFVTVNIGDGVTVDKYAANLALAAGRNRIVIAAFPVGVRLTITPTALYTGVIETTATFIVLED